MEYRLSKGYETPELMAKIMGPNPIKLCEELLKDGLLPPGSVVCDLGSGQGLTSVFMAKEYGFKVYAADLWSDPEENRLFFEQMGLGEEQIVAVKADANDLPFENCFFDAVVSCDSYNYFGRDKTFLDQKILPFVKDGGYVFACVTGMKRDLHDNLPAEILLSWTPEQMDYLHDAEYWGDIVGACQGAEVLGVYQMEGNEELWADWIAQDNEYAQNDRKAVEAGACAYLNFVAIVLRKNG